MQHNTLTVTAENMQAVARRGDLNRIRTMSTLDSPDEVVSIDAEVREQIGRALCLQYLLNQITSDNTHEEILDDNPIGHEEW
jgi:hypothetical protein